MRRIRLSKDASEFLSREVHYLRERSTSAARRFLDRMEAAKRNLSSFPLMGSLAEESVVRGARRLVTGDYVLVYDLTDEAVEILAIRHGRMSPDMQSSEEESGYEMPDDAS